MKHARLALALFALSTAATAAYAASCTEGGIVVSGGTCGVVGGHCTCTYNPQ